MRFATTMKRSDSCSPIGFPLALWALLSLTFRRRQTSQIRCYYLSCARCALEPRWVFPYLALSIGRCCLLPGGRHRLPHTRNEAVSLHAFALRLRTLHCLRLNLTSRLRLQGYVLTARYGFVRRRLSLLCNNNAYWRTPPSPRCFAYEECRTAPPPPQAPPPASGFESQRKNRHPGALCRPTATSRRR